jgi:hypothetical protein
MSQTTLDKFKSWAFPGLISVLGAIIWNDIKEIKNDVKALIAQSNQDKVRIDNLERVVYGDKKTAENIPSKNDQVPPSVFFTELVAVKPEETRFETHPETPETTAI